MYSGHILAYYVPFILLAKLLSYHFRLEQGEHAGSPLHKIDKILRPDFRSKFILRRPIFVQNLFCEGPIFVQNLFCEGPIFVQNLFCEGPIFVQNLFCEGPIGVQNLFCNSQN